MLLHGQPSNEPVVLDKIEDLYKRAVHADPTNANNFSNYGLFLAEVTLIHFIHSLGLGRTFVGVNSCPRMLHTLIHLYTHTLHALIGTSSNTHWG